MPSFHALPTRREFLANATAASLLAARHAGAGSATETKSVAVDKALIAITLDLEFPYLGSDPLGLRERKPERRNQELYGRGMPEGEEARRRASLFRRR